uniref:Uncharacterized protein n=1 Tax=Panagrolaimus superbus TaxID=310955 RepID=A0A914XV02_9BILA
MLFNLQLISKFKLTKCLAEMISGDVLPFSTVENFGFRIGDFVSYATPAFNAYVLKHVQDFGAAMSMDFGTLESNYFACTVHFLNSEWELTSWTLNFNEYDEKTSDAEHVRKNLLSILEAYGINIDLARKNITFTTDRGSNLLAALSDVIRIDDSCHQLNILSKRTITPYKAQYITNQIQLSDAVKETLKTCDGHLKALIIIIKAIL